MTVPLNEAIVAIHLALEGAGLDHAFGGALALAWCTEEPRATFDIDINVFAAPADARRVLAALPAGISHDTTSRSRLERDGQERLWWGRIAVDLFLSNTTFHVLVAEQVEHHPFAGAQLPFLGCRSLATFKAFFDRDKDWLDLEAMFAIGKVDPLKLRSELVDLLGADDPRVDKLDRRIERLRPDAD
jgi:hypothetical protein